VVDEEVDTTPEAVGTAQTGSGITGTIWHYPGEAVYKYGVIFPQGYTIWNKPKNFRTYADAEWFIKEVISPKKDVTPEEKTVPTIAGSTYMGLIESEAGFKWWVYKNKTRDSWYLYDPMGKVKNKIFPSKAKYEAFMFPSEVEEEDTSPAATTTTTVDGHGTGLLTNGGTVTQPTIPGLPPAAQSGAGAHFMGLGVRRRRRRLIW
jgi:hypothetical protein